MLHRLVDTIRHAGHLTGFEVYLGNLQRGRAFVPSVEEARRDFRDMLHSELYHSL